MNTKLLILAMLPMGCLFGQEQTIPLLQKGCADEEEYAHQEKTLFYDQAIRQTAYEIFINTINKAPLRLKSDEENTSGPQPYFDYFPAEQLLNNVTNSSPPIIHHYSVRQYQNVSVELDDIAYPELQCFEITDQYEIANTSGVAFNYHNTYFHYQKEGVPIATLMYIEGTTGFLRSTFKMVKKYATPALAAKLKLSPNPAKDKTILEIDILQQGGYSITLTDANGKLLNTPMAKRLLLEGTQQIPVSLSYPPGIYFIHLNLGSSTLCTEKLIIN